MSIAETPKRKARQAERVRRKKQNIYTWAAVAAVMLLIAGAIWWLSGDKPAAPQGEMPTKRLFAGDRMPNVAWNDLQGGVVRISDFEGKPLLINAWATWCPPCKAEMPMLEQFYLTYQAQGLVVLAVDSGEEVEQVNTFLGQNAFTFPIAIDTSGETLNRLGVRSLPTTIVVGRDGTVKHLYIGQLTDKQLNEEIVAFLGLK
jgi:thiol-disulfide isomerase/thioredoxin